MLVYPSLEDMVVDQKMQLERPQPTAPMYSTLERPTNVYDNVISPNDTMYPTLEAVEKINNSQVSMNEPIYGHQHDYPDSPRQMSRSIHSLVSQSPSIQSFVVAPVSSLSPGVAQANLSHGVRQIFVPKDQQGKVGLRFREVQRGLFIQFVLQNSTATNQGIRFGDQILAINGQEMFGVNSDKAMQIIGKMPNDEGVVFTVRDRPFCHVITLHKDENGKLGFTHKDNRVTAIVRDSSASRNGMTINQAIIEVDGISVVAYNTKEIAQTMEHCGKSVALTTMPLTIYQELIKKIDPKLLRTMQDHSVPVVN